MKRISILLFPIDLDAQSWESLFSKLITKIK